MLGGARRIAHIVETIEEGNQVIVLAGEIFGLGHGEFRAVSDTCFSRALGGNVNRALMVVKTGKCGSRIGLRHQDA